MNRYVSTYQKDYAWPDVLNLRGPQPSTSEDALCVCAQTRDKFKEVTELNGEDWSRMGPMGRLLEPKLYPARIETTEETGGIDRSRVWKQLEEKCPKLDKISKKPLPDESTSRADLMKTTYQMDYDESAAIRLTDDETSGQQPPCRGPIKIVIESECPSHCRSSRYNGISSDKKRDRRKSNGKCIMKCGKNIDGGQMRLPPWRSEYQDNVGRIGQGIIKNKLLHAKKKTASSRAASK